MYFQDQIVHETRTFSSVLNDPARLSEPDTLHTLCFTGFFLKGHSLIRWKCCCAYNGKKICLLKKKNIHVVMDELNSLIIEIIHTLLIKWELQMF